MVFTEENEVYCIDCNAAVWAVDEIHDKFKTTGSSLNDVDFVIETSCRLLMVEYKNASIVGAAYLECFEPSGDNKINNVVKNIMTVYIICY